ncbi:hypothetical protein CSB08_00705 [Candidatus Gracilibacteria bacterium]|nr:MAG: hypothetical protein CSB08_00705 [Candidatus Gracilibacteria bacterium]PIE85751.1 MAG: hypothetical protein CSA08_00555 [Candidatus Gracilibacteria bacterium]
MKTKILDFIIIFLLVFLAMQFFAGNDKKELSGKVLISSTDDNYTIPASVGLSIANDSPEAIKLNTCDNITITSSGDKINVSDSICKDIEVKSGDTYIVDYASEYEEFKVAGDYTFKVNLPGKEEDIISQFKIENKGTFTKLFTSLFYAPIYNLMVFLIYLFNGSLGLAILAITIILRIILLYPQHKMMVSQKKLQAIQPKIKKIQEENKGNQQIIGVKLMELYKKEKVNPMGSCGFMLIQMPILLVIYNIILGITDLSNHYHIYGALKNFDLSKVDYNFLGIDLLGTGGITGIILGVSVAIIQYIQVKLSLKLNKKDKKDLVLEKKKGDTGYSQFMPDPDMINKFMLYGMPGMVGVFTYSLLAGVGVYWGISTLFMIFQQLFVNKILKK